MTHDPMAHFLAWYAEAQNAGLAHPDAMMLATATPDGRPSLRTVFYRPASDGGIRFFTNYGGRKARELEQNPRAAVLFYWQPMKRQVRMEGVVARCSAEESDAYFAARPRESQLSAWVSPQSRPIRALTDLEAEAAALEHSWAGRPVERPEFWGGYRLDPDHIEFWTGRDHRMHERVLFVKSDGVWTRSLLGP
jgi:pyridoxamine 5'-phosphate oxidase